MEIILFVMMNFKFSWDNQKLSVRHGCQNLSFLTKFILLKLILTTLSLEKMGCLRVLPLFNNNYQKIWCYIITLFNAHRNKFLV